MSSEIKPDKAINFLSLVRQDLNKIQTQSSDSTVVTGRFCEVQVDTRVESGSEFGPAVIGRFEIIEQIGEGGFARVFLANDPNLDREVALKVPKPHVLMSAEAVARFEREAKSAAILSHPNIVPVFEGGSLGPIQFIASEFCPGPTLRQWFSGCKKKPSPRMAVEIVSQLADALRHAHQRGIVHRDLKPANIILHDGEESMASRLRITDFGLARHMSDDESLTANGAIVGTPAYMSPEQASGTTDVDHRTDIYSLGMILYELLTGKCPFKRKNHMASIAAVINEGIPSIRESNSKVDQDLAAVCRKALAKNPDSRYQSAHDFRRDLLRWTEGRAVSVRKPSQAETFGRWVKRNPVVSTAILFSSVCLFSGLAFSFAQWQKAQTSLNQSILQRDRAEKNVDELHRTIVSALEVSLEPLEEVSTFSPVQQEVLDHLMSAHKRLIEEEAERVEITPATFECYERLARVYRKTGRYEQANEILERADKMLEPFLKSEPDRTTYALSASAIESQKGLLLAAQGDLLGETAILRKSQAYYESSEGTVDRVEWLSKGYTLYRCLGYSLFNSRKMDECRVEFEKARLVATEALELAPEDEEMQFNFARSLLDISHVCRSTKLWPVGLENLEQAEQLLMVIAANPESEIDCRYRLAYVRYELGLFLRIYVKDYESAESYLLSSIETLKELVKESPGDFDYRNRLSHAYIRLIDVYRDQEMFDEVLRLVPIAETYHLHGVPRKADPRISRCELKRGRIWAYEYDDQDAAIASFKRAVEISESSQYFKLSDDLQVDALLDAYEGISEYYDSIRQSTKAIDAAGEGYRLAVQRCLKHPGKRSLEIARRLGTIYADRLVKTKQHGLAKAVMDTLAEAGSDSARVQYDLAHKWAKFDYNQRKLGEEKTVWEASRKKSLELLSRAIDLGFDNYERIRNGKYLKEYRHLAEFEKCCDRIRP